MCNHSSDTFLMLWMKKNLNKRLNLKKNDEFVFQRWVWRAAVLEGANAELAGKARMFLHCFKTHSKRNDQR